MTEYNKIADGYFTSGGVAKFLELPFLPDQIEIWNLTKWGTNTNHLVNYATGFANSAAGTAYATVETGDTELDNVTITSGGFSFINADTYRYGPTIALAATFVTKAAAAVVTTASPHGLQTGDAVLLYGTTSMLQISGQVYTVTVLSTTTFSIPVNSSGFASAATAGFMKKVLYPDLYIPYGCVITNITAASSAVITTGVNHGFVVGQEVFISVPSQWGMVEIDTLQFNQNNVIPQQAYVTAVTANTITVNINSTAFTAFAYPTSAVAALSINFPMVFGIGDQNSGATNAVTPLPVVPPAITIPGAFYANTRQGVLIGTGDGTTIMHATSDVIRWRAIFPDQLQTS